MHEPHPLNILKVDNSSTWKVNEHLGPTIAIVNNEALIMRPMKLFPHLIFNNGSTNLSWFSQPSFRVCFHELKSKVYFEKEDIFTWPIMLIKYINNYRHNVLLVDKFWRIVNDFFFEKYDKNQVLMNQSSN